MDDIFHGKLTSAQDALSKVKSGRHILIASGAAEPQVLVDALAARGENLADAEVIHLLTLGSAPYAEKRFEGRLRHNALFIGSNVREAVKKGLADYTPCLLSEIPGLIRSGRLPVDVALIHTPPPEDGFCSLGVAVDIVKAAVETAEYVVAQVNPRMPWTLGDSFIKVDDVDAFVLGDHPIFSLPEPEQTAAAICIGRYASALIEDGATLQIGIGSVPNAILAALTGKKDLGIHSEMISDGILPLLECGALTGSRKTLHPGKIVASFAMGSERLYKQLSRNPLFEFYPSDYVNSPSVIGRNDHMVCVNSALQVDLTGQVAADSIGKNFFSGFGGQLDFVRGAALSHGGKSIIAMPATAKKGAASRIVACLSEGTGVVTTRADVDFVVTEYGIASLKAKTIRERAVALIQLAHPDFREELTAAAKTMGYLDETRIVPSSAEPYHVEWECERHFRGKAVKFRPLKPSDERRLKELFYTQSPETTYRRYGGYLKRLSERQFQQLVAIDYQSSLAIAAFSKEDGRERMIAVGRYILGPGKRLAEAAFTVHDDYQGLGIGTFLVDYLTWIAKERGLTGFQAEMAGLNARMRHILARCFRRVDEKDLGEDGVAVTIRVSDWKGHGNPALAPETAAAG